METGKGRTGDSQGRAFNWMSLLIMIGAVALASLTATTMFSFSYWGDYSHIKLEIEIGTVVCFLALAASTLAIGLVVYSREDMAKVALIVAIALVLVEFAIRTEMTLRSLAAMPD